MTKPHMAMSRQAAHAESIERCTATQPRKTGKGKGKAKSKHIRKGVYLTFCS